MLVCGFLTSRGVVIVADFNSVDKEAEEVMIARSVKSIPPYAFAENENLRSVRFEAGSRCASIGEGAFYRCAALKEIAVPPSLREVGTNAFAWCTSLKAFDLRTVTKIGTLAFAYCESLESVDFSPSLKNIGNNAFSRCSSLTEVYIPDSVTLLESYAFSDCTSLLKARMPANDSLLGELIFEGCESLTELTQPSTEAPPFDCNSFIFDPADEEAYARCRLSAADPDACRRSPGWRLFQSITPIE